MTKHTLSCEINSIVGGDHAHCECLCHKSLPAIPPSRIRRSIKGAHIKDMLKDLRLVLCNTANGFESDYFESKRGVPCVWVIVNKRRYQFTFFGRTQIFRIFAADQSHVDVRTRNEVVEYFRSLKNE